MYPTVSNDLTPNSDMSAGPEEHSVVRHQFARFASQCRVYAPLYRQVTLTALRSVIAGKPMPIDRELAYNDVRDAWNYYLEHDNKGRGVVLIGHSQGSGMLMQLVAQRDRRQARAVAMVSALLLGTNVPVPNGKDVGGAFQHMPLCKAASQTGCVIAYVSFRRHESAAGEFPLRQGAGREHVCCVRESGGTRRWQWRAARISLVGQQRDRLLLAPAQGVGDAGSRKSTRRS